jgi:hypothetical protein
MRENEFRDRLRDALGEPPNLAAPMLKPSNPAAPRSYPRGMAALAIALAILLVIVLVASRIALRPQGTNLPAAQAAPDSFPCSLPVVAVSEAGGPGQNPAIGTGETSRSILPRASAICRPTAPAPRASTPPSSSGGCRRPLGRFRLTVGPMPT